MAESESLLRSVRTPRLSAPSNFAALQGLISWDFLQGRVPREEVGETRARLLLLGGVIFTSWRALVRDERLPQTLGSWLVPTAPFPLPLALKAGTYHILPLCSWAPPPQKANLADANPEVRALCLAQRGTLSSIPSDSSPLPESHGGRSWGTDSFHSAFPVGCLCPVWLLRMNSGLGHSASAQKRSHSAGLAPPWEERVGVGYGVSVVCFQVAWHDSMLMICTFACY